MKKSYFIVLLAVGLALLIGYAWLVEPNRLVVRQVEIRDSLLARAWPGLTILHLSDLHIERMGVREANLLTAMTGLKPDLIVMSGDFKQWRADPGPAQQFLAQLSAPLGVYGVLGDADQVDNSPKGCAFCHPEERYDQRLASPTILQNELRRIVLQGGATLDIAGVSMEEEGNDEWLRKLQARAREDHGPLLIISHRSERWRDTPLAGRSLWLCGDTHGGQIWLPDWLWRLVPYKSDPQHMGGVYGNGQGGWLVVNRGIGVTGRFPFRFGVPPVLVVITFAESEGGMGR